MQVFENQKTQKTHMMEHIPNRIREMGADSPRWTNARFNAYALLQNKAAQVPTITDKLTLVCYRQTCYFILICNPPCPL